MLWTIIVLVLFGIPILMMVGRPMRWIIALLSLTTGWLAVLIILEVIMAEIAVGSQKA
jgi:hypothetical protein